MKIENFYKQLTKVVGAGEDRFIDYIYNVGEEYSFVESGNVITLTLKGKKDGPALRKTFNKIVRTFSFDKLEEPTAPELPWVGLIEWIFHHYKWGSDDSSNCILKDGEGNVLAISDNGANQTRICFGAGPFLGRPIIYRGENGLYKEIDTKSKEFIKFFGQKGCS